MQRQTICRTTRDLAQPVPATPAVCHVWTCTFLPGYCRKRLLWLGYWAGDGELGGQDTIWPNTAVSFCPCLHHTVFLLVSSCVFLCFLLSLAFCLSSYVCVFLSTCHSLCPTICSLMLVSPCLCLISVFYCLSFPFSFLLSVSLCALLPVF